MSTEFSLTVCHALDDVPGEEWDKLANPEGAPFDPFVSYTFFHALETSRSVAIDTGWSPHHLIIREEGGALVGALPLYLKNHSQGEYVFDHGWAHGFELAGGDYYPKLLTAVPFTPVTGRRIFTAGEHSAALQGILIDAALGMVEDHNLSSFHINFMVEDTAPLLEEKGFLLRSDTQFHWVNEDYQDFDAFLDRLSSRKRKAIKRERRIALQDGLEVEWVSGDDINARHWDAFYSFYQDTGMRKWGMPYLTRAFFEEISPALKEHIVLIFAKHEGRYIAGALNFIGQDALFGRYWGSLEHHDCLHFEICYYQAIDYALKHGLKRVEAGAQGEHKLARGYAPTSTFSAHYIANAALRVAVKDFLVDEGCFKTLRDEALSAHLPYKKG